MTTTTSAGPVDAGSEPTIDRAGPGERRFPTLRMPSTAGLVAGGALIGVIALLVAVSDTLPVFVIGLIVAYILDPVVTWLARHRVPRGLATLISIAVLTAILIVLALVFVDTVVTQAIAFVALVPASFLRLRDWITSLGLPPGMQADILGFLDSIKTAVIGFDVTLLVTPVINGVFTLLGSFFTLLVLPFFLFYVLAGRPAIARSVDETVPQAWRDDVRTVIRIVLDSFGTYVKAEAIVAAILGLLTWVGLMVLSVAVNPKFADFALLLAVIAAFSELIPNFGPWIAAIPAVLFTLTIAPAAVVVVILLYLVLMFIEGQVLVPKIEGGAFSFHPALVLFIVVAGVSLMGLLGAILALPVTAAVWRVTRYAFRRASGRPPGLATATGGDHDGGLITAPGIDQEPSAPSSPAGPA